MATEPLSNESLSQEQELEAQRIFHELEAPTRERMWQLARLLAQKPTGEMLGKTEYQVRDLVHQWGVQAIEVALKERQKGGIKDPV